MAESRAETRPAAAIQEDGLATFFQQHRRRAYLFALQMVGDPEDAMELTQEAFLRLHKCWHKRSASGSALPLLYPILRNLALDLLRKRAVRREEEAALEQEPTPEPGPEALASQEQLSAALWQAILRLPQAQREVLLLKDFHGLRYDEIAHVTGSTRALVSSRLHDARERLRRRLARYL